MKFSVGQFVKTRVGGSPQLVVLEVGSELQVYGVPCPKEEAVLCGWWDGSHWTQHYFSPSSLVACDD